MARSSVLIALFCGVSAATVSSVAFAQTAEAGKVEEVVVTGSRTIVNGNNSPTPVTVVSVQTLAATTPSAIPDALNKLPVFSGSSSVQTNGNASANASGNYLNLRGFGVIRTLILQDGRRVASTAANGFVDTNTLPQMLVQRVDVVTGGASAVYGSDAVTGVVNFVVDNRYNGLKLQAQAGISGHSDDGSWKFGVAGGKSLLGGKLHVEGSFEHYSSDGVGDKAARPIGAKVYCIEGAGSVANPFKLYSGCRNNNSSFGGLIVSGPLAGMDFASNGQLTPFVHGTATGSSTVEANAAGGDGAYGKASSLTAYLKSDQTFGRADYDFTDDISGFAEVGYTRSYNGNNFYPVGFNNLTISVNNAYVAPALAGLTPAQQAAAAAAGKFNISKVFGDQPVGAVQSAVTNLTSTVGLKGKFGSQYIWDAYYTHAQATTAVANIGNQNNGRELAALDAVVNPANGQIVCNVTLTNPGLYPGCTPLNPFGPTAAGKNGLNYITQTTSFTLNSYMDDFGANIAGSVFDDWAGPVRVALSGEYRNLRLTSVSAAQPTQKLDCTGLRFNCTQGSTTVWQGNTVSNMNASESVGEVALESTVPLLKDVFLAQSLSLNGAVRYAHYSASGNATTWKVGLDWHVNDDLSFRGTRSQDIRAPTLNDLFSPIQASPTGFTDIHTGVSAILTTQSQGNPNLVPEVAQTQTYGVVYRPHWLPRLSVSVDYYDITMNNAITTVGGNNAATLAACEASGGASPLCSLYVRPLPFSNRTAANYPTLIITQGLNIAKTWTHGIDAEVNYNFEMADIAKSLGGHVDLRLLMTYQPILDSITLPGQPTVNTAGVANLPSFKLTFIGGYRAGPWQFNVQTRWRAAENQSGNPALVFAVPAVSAVSFTDLTVTRNLTISGHKMAAFLSVQNLFDQAPPVYASPALAANPNFGDPIVNGDDVIGRYFTVGARMSF